MAGGILTPGLRVERSATVRKIRELPVLGEIVVEIGAKVDESQVVGRAVQPGEMRILRIPETLGIEPFEVIKGLKVREGDRVEAGQLLCEHAGLFGLFKTRYSAPEAGTIELITEKTGHLGLRLPSKAIEIDAYLRGTIVAVEPGKSATVEASGAFVQGIFGVGGEKKGRLVCLDVPPDQAVTVKDIPDSCAGLILAGGTQPELEALKAASLRGAVGMITGAIDDSVLAGYLGYDLGIALTGDEELDMTLIVTEGFGPMAMASRVHDLLNDLNGFAASINGATQVRAGALRPELVIYSESSAGVSATQSERSLTLGARIRIVRVPYFGMEATVVDLPAAAQVIETGAKTRVLKAKLTDGREVVVPRANVELV